MLRLIFVILILMTSVAFSQMREESEQKKIAKAEKIDEFPLINDCDFRGRIDNLFITLQDKPDTTGYIILYQGKNVLPANYESRFVEKNIRGHILLRNVDAARVVFINGGFREELATELWIVPKGAAAPKPTDTIPKPKIPTDKTLLFDKNYLSNQYEGDYSSEFILESVKARIEEENRIAEEEYKRENPDAANEAETVVEETESEKETPQEIEDAKFFWTSDKFGEFLKSRKDSRGLIIFYADDQYYDIGKLLNHIEEGKRRISSSAKIPSDRIQILFGGYRNMMEAEFWIIPKKGEPPAAKPDERPIEIEEAQ